MSNGIKENNRLSRATGWIGKLLQNKGVTRTAGALGVCLLLLMKPVSAAKETVPEQETDSSASMTAVEYEKALEQRLEQLISSLEGAGEVTVMVTVESSAQTVYAREQSQSAQSEQNRRSSSNSSQYVVIQQNGQQAALEEGSLQPEVQGVAVICEGAEDMTLVYNITQMVSTVLGITTNRVYVTK